MGIVRPEFSRYMRPSVSLRTVSGEKCLPERRVVVPHISRLPVVDDRESPRRSRRVSVERVPVRQGPRRV